VSGPPRPGRLAEPRPGAPRCAGVTLPELAAALALAGIVAAFAAPALAAQWRALSLRAAVDDLASLVRRARHEAAARTRVQALLFQNRRGRWFVTRYEDGNRNGVRGADLEIGADPARGGPIDLVERWGCVRPGLPPTPVPRIPPARGALLPGADPLQLSGTDRISCYPDGTCTPGSIYLTAGGAEAAAVVIYGGTGRVRTWRYVPREVRWTRY
jgi:prepilin-type N-terminal cleavage/methylation domain-containing protein